METWMKVYEECLLEQVTKRPKEYAYTPDRVPGIAAKMRDAFAAKTYNKDGHAIKAACKKLKIPYTYAAINQFIRENP